MHQQDDVFFNFISTSNNFYNPALMLWNENSYFINEHTTKCLAQVTIFAELLLCVCVREVMSRLN